MERPVAVLVDLVQLPEVVLAGLVESGVAVGQRQAGGTQDGLAVGLATRVVHLRFEVEPDVLDLAGVDVAQDALTLRAAQLRHLLQRRRGRIDLPSLELEARVGQRGLRVEVLRRNLTIGVELAVEDLGRVAWPGLRDQLRLRLGGRVAPRLPNTIELPKLGDQLAPTLVLTGRTTLVEQPLEIRAERIICISGDVDGGTAARRQQK